MGLEAIGGTRDAAQATPVDETPTMADLLQHKKPFGDHDASHSRRWLGPAGAVSGGGQVLRCHVVEMNSLERAVASSEVITSAIGTCASLAELDGLHATVPAIAWSGLSAQPAPALLVRQRLYSRQERAALFSRRKETVQVYREKRKAKEEASNVVQSAEGMDTIRRAVNAALLTQRQSVGLLGRRIDTLRKRAGKVAVLEAERQRLVQQRDKAVAQLRKHRLGLRKALRKETRSAKREELRAAIEEAGETLRRGMPQNDPLREIAEAFRRLMVSHRTSDGRDEEALEQALRSLRLDSAPTLPPRASDTSRQPFDYLGRTLAEAEALAGLVEEFRARLEPLSHMEKQLADEATEERVNEAESSVRRDYRVMRRAGFAWTRLGIQSAFQTWRARARTRRQQRERASKRDKADRELRRDAAEAQDRLRSMERSKWKKEWDEEMEREVWVHQETGETAFHRPRERDYVHGNATSRSGYSRTTGRSTGRLGTGRLGTGRLGTGRLGTGRSRRSGLGSRGSSGAAGKLGVANRPFGMGGGGSSFAGSGGGRSSFRSRGSAGAASFAASAAGGSFTGSMQR